MLEMSFRSTRKKPVSFIINRGTEKLTNTITVDSAGTIGIRFNADEMKQQAINYSLFAALPIGANQKAWGKLLVIMLKES